MSRLSPDHGPLPIHVYAWSQEHEIWTTTCGDQDLLAATDAAACATANRNLGSTGLGSTGGTPRT